VAGVGGAEAVGAGAGAGTEARADWGSSAMVPNTSVGAGRVLLSFEAKTALFLLVLILPLVVHLVFPSPATTFVFTFSGTVFASPEAYELSPAAAESGLTETNLIGPSMAVATALRDAEAEAVVELETERVVVDMAWEKDRVAEAAVGEV
jgi:hypothetical protein